MVQQNSNIRVRIAPSPTGIPHIGNTRTALFNYLFAKHNKGEFLLRIEDTDRNRLVEEAESTICEILEWLGMQWDGAVVRQSERLEVYKEAAEQLLKKGYAKKDENAIRFTALGEKSIGWNDGIGKKHISFEAQDIEDFVILKSDGFPTYHLANVIDDHEFGITHVIRGEEWISSTPKHILLYEAFSWQHPEFVHLPVILGPDRTKLSKRHGAKSALDYRDEGYLKEALLNYMALLGWNPGGDKEIMSMDEMIKLFDLEDINSANPIFDQNKLLWMNGEYIRKFQVSRLRSELQNFGGRANLKKIDDAVLNKFIALAQTRIKTLAEFYELVQPFIERVQLELTAEEKKIVEALRQELSGVQKWNKDEILNTIRKVLSQQKCNMKTIYKVVLGAERGLPLSDVFELLGKDKTLSFFLAS